MTTSLDRGQQALVPAGIWTVDAARSVVGFDVRHLKLTKVHGCFHHFEGALRCDPDYTVSITGSIDVASIDTGDPRRDDRLRDEEFFDVHHYPTIAISAAATPVSPGEAFAVSGEMTIRGVRRPLELEVMGSPMSVDGNGDVRIRARGSVSRRAFGLNWDPAFAGGGLVIDDRVALRLDVVVVENAPGVRSLY